MSLKKKDKMTKNIQNNTLNEIADILHKHNNFIISSHIHLDGDALGSEIALFAMLKQLKKNVKIINQDNTPEIYQFLPYAQEIISSKDISKDSYFDIEPETVLIALDSSNLDRIGEINIDFKKVDFIINIDHHPSNNLFGKYNYINSKASSVGEILYSLCKKIKCTINQNIAVALYTAIITDTGSFRYTNTKAKTFQIASDLVKNGVNPANISNHIYNNNNPSTIKLLGKALNELVIDSSSKIAWTFITREMLNSIQARDEDVEGIVDKILSIKNIQVSVFFREAENGFIKVSFRSRGKFNVDYFARLFGGGGHHNAAGCNIKDNLNDAMTEVITKLKTEIKNI